MQLLPRIVALAVRAWRRIVRVLFSLTAGRDGDRLGAPRALEPRRNRVILCYAAVRHQRARMIGVAVTQSFPLGASPSSGAVLDRARNSLWTTLLTELVRATSLSRVVSRDLSVVARSRGGTTQSSERFAGLLSTAQIVDLRRRLRMRSCGSSAPLAGRRRASLMRYQGGENEKKTRKEDRIGGE